MNESGKGECGQQRPDELFRATLDAVIVIDTAGIVRDWNPAAEEMFGFAREHAVGCDLAELIVPGPLRAAHRNGLRRYLDTGESSIIGRRVEFRAVRRDGTEFPAEVTVIRLGDGDPPRFGGFIRPLVGHHAARRENVRLQQRMAFLAQAGLVLDRSLDYDETLRSLADLTIPELADLTVIDLVDPDTTTQTAVTAAADPEMARALEAMRAAHPVDRAGAHPVAQVWRGGGSILLPDLSPGFLARIAQGEEHLALMHRLHYQSVIVVPLIARQRAIGTLSLLRLAGARRYDNEDLVLAEDLARRSAMVVDNARLFAATRQLARTLQDSLLPRALPEIPGVRVSARYRAALEGQEVGGDFYDAFAIDAGRWGIAIGDVCGKGAEAAALTSLARYTIRAVAGGGAGAAEVMQLLNQAVARDGTADAVRFLTTLFAIVAIEPGGLKLDLAAAGHPPPLVLRREGPVEQVAVAGPLIGISPDARYRTASTRLRPGDAIVLYTDGLTDARAPSRILSDRELSAIVASARGLDPDGIAEYLEETATAGEHPRDDIAILVLDLPQLPSVLPEPAPPAPAVAGPPE